MDRLPVTTTTREGHPLLHLCRADSPEVPEVVREYIEANYCLTASEDGLRPLGEECCAEAQDAEFSEDAEEPEGSDDQEAEA